MSLDVVDRVENPVRVGQIGIGGGIGPLHIDEMEKNANFKLVAGCDSRLENESVAKHAARITALGGKLYADYRELLQDPQVEAVCIAAPHFLHREMSIAAFQAGKHVLVEKPMAVYPDDCRAMLEAQKLAGKVGAVQMQHVGRKSILELRQHIQSGAIGRIKEIFLSSLWWRENPYYQRVAWAGKKMFGNNWNLDGIMFNQAIHFINQTLILCAPGELPAVSGTRDVEVALYKFHDTSALEMEDCAFITATLDTPDAPRLFAIATTCSRVDRHSIELIGEHGRALWNGVGYLFVDGQPALEFTDDSKEFGGASRVFNSFASAVRGGPRPITDFAAIARTTDFVFSCYQRADWKIKKAPWAATDGLPEIFRQVHQQRNLPARLKTVPTWA
jgi:predicted dehydrogenase